MRVSCTWTHHQVHHSLVHRGTSTPKYTHSRAQPSVACCVVALEGALGGSGGAYHRQPGTTTHGAHTPDLTFENNVIEREAQGALEQATSMGGTLPVLVVGTFI